MRLFNVKVFDGYVTGTAPVYTDPIFNDLLGTAERILLSTFIDQVQGASPTIEIRSQSSNDGFNWGYTSFLPEASGALTPGQPFFTTGANDVDRILGAYVRYEIKLGAADNKASIRLWACGRGDQSGEIEIPFNPRP